MKEIAAGEGELSQHTTSNFALLRHCSSYTSRYYFKP